MPSTIRPPLKIRSNRDFEESAAEVTTATTRRSRGTTILFTATEFYHGRSTLSDDGTFPARDTELHFTFGGGVVVQKWVQIDAAVSHSGIGTEYLLSLIARF